MTYRKPRDGTMLTDWQEDLNTSHRKVRTRVEHTLARMKNHPGSPRHRTGTGIRHRLAGLC